MHVVLAWFITFNFINIAWVFFRAKDFGDALKVLKGMFGFNGIMNSYAYEEFLKSGHLSTKKLFLNIAGDSFTLKYLLFGFIIVLLFKNSQELTKNLSFNKKELLFFAVVFSVGILYLNNMTEFLYFNF